MESLIGRIERLGFTPMHPNVGVALDLWLSGIKDLRNVRKNELANMSESPHIHNNGSKSHMQGGKLIYTRLQLSVICSGITIRHRIPYDVSTYCSQKILLAIAFHLAAKI